MGEGEGKGFRSEGQEGDGGAAMLRGVMDE